MKPRHGASRHTSELRRWYIARDRDEYWFRAYGFGWVSVGFASGLNKDNLQNMIYPRDGFDRGFWQANLDHFIDAFELGGIGFQWFKSKGIRGATFYTAFRYDIPLRPRRQPPMLDAADWDWFGQCMRCGAREYQVIDVFGCRKIACRSCMPPAEIGATILKEWLPLPTGGIDML